MKHTLAKTAFTLLFAAAAATASAVPQLKTQAEPAADGEVKIKPLANAQGVPPPTPESRSYRMTSPGGQSKDVKFYLPRDLWHLRAFAAEWKDKKGNVMRLARVKSLVPSFEREDWYKEEIEKQLDKMEKEFGGTDEELEAWKKAWGGSGKGTFATVRGKRYYIDFVFAEPVTGANVEKMLKTAASSLSAASGASNRTGGTMKWWTQENAQYKFMTDLDRAKGGKFIKDAMRLMEAMRKSYEFYVPPTNSVGQCTVRVFKTMEGYKEYLASNHDALEWSAGLWDPSREELLIAAEDRDQAQNTMRHEAFHQYLHYATKNGHHALWFNEGHACFFESVQYNPAKNTVKVTDKGSRAMWTARNPEAVANALEATAAMDREAFYSGDVNLHYVSSWALVYFLEKGAWTHDEFAPYRKVVPAYLEAMSNGADAQTATSIAFKGIRDAKRDIAADFLKFWTRYRKQALNAR